jgi:ubiquinol-cytochrome c reductase cytochrome b/c1 subunit
MTPAPASVTQDVGLFAVLVILISDIVGLVLSPSPSAAGLIPTFHLAFFVHVPEWYTLPLYALLRAVPDKLAGLVTVFAAMLAPLIWPWARADALRAGPTRWAWRLLCIAFALVWLGLGYLGSMPPEGLVPTATRLAALFYFAFFLVLPFVLGLLIERRGAGAAPS